MTQLLVVLLMTFSIVQSQAQSEKPDELKLVCATHPLTTSFLFEPQEEVVNVRVIHHNGIGSAPIHDGVVVTDGLKFLQEKSEKFGQMGDRYTLVFDKKFCERHEDKIVNCNGGKALTQDGKTVRAMIYSSKVTKKAFGQAFESINIRVMLQFEKTYYTYALDYEPSTCI